MAHSGPDKPEASATSAPVKARRPWTWKRRLKVGAVSVLVAALAFRLLMMVLLPIAIERTARQFGYSVSYQRIQLSLVGANAAIWGIEVGTRDGAQQIFKSDYAYANLSTLQLLRLRLKAWRLEADDVSVDVVRRPDGSIPLLQALPSMPPPAAGPARPVDFSSPLEVDAVRLHNLTVHVRDESVTPVFDHTFRTDLRVSDVGRPGMQATLDVDSTTDSLFDAISISGRATATPAAFDANVSFALRGVRTDAAAPYLGALRIDPGDRSMTVKGDASVSLVPVAGAPGQVSGGISVSNVRVETESETTASLARADIQIASLSPSGVHVQKVAIEGGNARAERQKDGRLRLGPLVFADGGPADTSARPAPGPAHTAGGGAPFDTRIDEITLDGLNLDVADRAVAPENTFGLHVEKAEVRNIATHGSADSVASLSATVTSPGFFGRLSAEAQATPLAPSPGGTFTVKVAGIHPDALAPYLEYLGVHPTLESASLSLEGTVSIDTKPGEPSRLSLKLANTSLVDSGAELFAMPSVTLDGLTWRADSGLEAASIEITGPVLAAERLTDGRIVIPGLRINPEAPAPSTAPVPLRLPVTLPSKLPPVTIGKLSWGGARIRLTDRAAPGADPIEIADSGVEIHDLTLAPRPGAPAPNPGTLKAWLAAPGLVDHAVITGTVAPGPGALSVKVSGTGDGVNLARLDPYLKPLGVEPTLQQGKFRFSLSSRIEQEPDSVRVSLDIRDAALSQGDHEVAGASAVSLSSIEVGPQGLAVGKVAVRGVRASAARAADGSIDALGVRLIPTPPAPKTGPALPDPFELIASLGSISLEGVDAQGVNVKWSDQRGRSPVETDITLSAALGPLAVNRPNAAPAPFQLELAGTGIAGKLQVKGEAAVNPDALEVNAAITGEAIDPAVISAYLPAGTEARFKDGRLAGSMKARLERAEPGGLSARLELSGIDWAQGPTPLFQLGKVSLDVERFDPASFDTHVRTFEVTGLAGSVGRNADGSIDAFGFALAAPSAQPQEHRPAAAAAPAPVPAADVRDIVAGSQAALPLVSVDKFDVHVDRLSFTDRARPESAPVSLVGAHAYSKAPITLLGPNPESNPPSVLAFETGVDPVVQRLAVNIQSSPFAPQPSASIRVEVSGIDGEGIARALPELKDFIGAADLRGGRFTTSLDAEATVRRRGPALIDLGHGIELACTIGDTKLTNSQGAVLAGVDKVRAEGVKIDVTSGGVAAKSLEVTGLSGLAWRDEQGVHACGALLQLPALGGRPADAAPVPPAPPPAEAGTAAPPGPAPTERPAPPEFRLDRLTLSGINFQFEDRAVTPPVTIPLNALDADIRGLSSRALTQDRPVKFNVSAGAGKVKLPKVKRGGLLTGALSESESVELEDRDFFSQCIASGTISMNPSPHGRASAAISGVELAAVRGLAAAEGASVGGGVFDGRVDVRTSDRGGLEVRSVLVLTDLRYKEPPEGPVAKGLSLPVPMDVAIGAVEAPDGSITLPVNVTLTDQGVSSGEIISAAAGAIAQVVATAVASAPVKVVTGFAGLFGDTKGDITWVEEEPVTLAYRPGVSLLDDASEAKLDTILERARTNKKVQVAISHAMGTSDAALCESRTNPPADVVRALADSLRDRRTELLQRRAALLPAAEAEAIRADPEPASLNQLRDVQVQLASVDDAMDRLYDLLKPGAERTAGRRTRAGCLELADGRLNAVRRTLSTLGGPAAISRTAVAVPHADVTDEEESHLLIQVRHRSR